MSIVATNWVYKVIRQEQLSPAQRHILLALAHKHHSKTGLCCPSIDTIAGMSGLSSRRVQSNIRVLQKKGIVKVRKRSVCGFQTSNQYDLAGVTKKAPLAGVTGESPDRDSLYIRGSENGNVADPGQIMSNDGGKQ